MTLRSMSGPGSAEVGATSSALPHPIQNRAATSFCVPHVAHVLLGRSTDRILGPYPSSTATTDLHVGVRVAGFLADPDFAGGDPSRWRALRCTSMEALLGLAGYSFVAAVTPGPNN